MPKENTKEKSNKSRISQFSRKNTKTRSRRKRPIRSRSKGKQNASNVHLFATHYLNSISSLKIDYAFKTGIFQENSDIIQMIKDIYPTLKKHTNFISEDASFNKDMEPFDFLIYLLEAYDKHQDEYTHWSIGYNEKQKKFKILYIHDYDDIGVNGRSQPLDFLANLQIANEKLYELFIAYLSLLNKSIKPVFWYESYNHESGIDCLENYWSELVDEGNQEMADEYEECIDFYNSRFPKTLQYNIQDCKISKPLFKETLSKIKVKSKREKQIVKFLKKHLNLIDETQYTLGDFYLTETEEEESAMTIADYAIFMFSYNDLLFEHIEECYQMNANEYGVIPFRVLRELGSRKKIPDLPNRYVAMLDDLGEVVEAYAKSP